MATYTEQDLFKTADMLEKTYNLEGEISNRMEEIIQNLDWSTLSIVKATRHVAEDMGLISQTASEDEWIALCKTIYSETFLPLNELTVEEFVDLLFWTAIFSLMVDKNIALEKQEIYVRTWFPELRSKFFTIKSTCSTSTTRLSLRQLTYI